MESFNCTIPSNHILNLHQIIPYCKEPVSAERIYYIMMELWSEFASQPQNFGCRYVLMQKNLEMMQKITIGILSSLKI